MKEGIGKKDEKRKRKTMKKKGKKKNNPPSKGEDERCFGCFGCFEGKKVLALIRVFCLFVIDDRTMSS